MTSVPILKKELDALNLRVERIEKALSLELPEKTQDPEPEPEPPKKPQGGTRHWGSGPGQHDAATSRRWRNR